MLQVPAVARLASALAAVMLTLSACSSDGSSSGSVELITVEVPAEVTGTLTVTVEEGDVGADGLSDFNFGELVTDDGLVLFDLAADVARDAGLTRDQLVNGIVVTATLDGPGVASLPETPSYRIGTLSHEG